MLRRCDLSNEDVYRYIFRESKPDAADNGSQFAAKLQIYVSTWIETAGVVQTFDGLRDKVLREQFLNVCHEELTTFLRKKMPEIGSIEKVAHMPEQYVDVHGCTLSIKANKKGSCPQRTLNGSSRSLQLGIMGESLRMLMMLARNCLSGASLPQGGHHARLCKPTQQTKKMAVPGADLDKVFPLLPLTSAPTCMTQIVRHLKSFFPTADLSPCQASLVSRGKGFQRSRLG